MKRSKLCLGLLIVLALAMTVLPLSSCSLLNGESSMTELVQGNLDSVYLGKVTPEYLKLVDSTKEECQANYLEGLEFEADYFAYYWGILAEDEQLSDLSEQLQQRIIDLYQAIYARAKYTVQKASLQDDYYTVKVVVEPIDIMVQATELGDSGSYEPLEQYYRKANAKDWSVMSETEYWQLTEEYGSIIVEMVESLLPDLGYGESRSQILQVEQVDGYWQVNSDDFAVLDTYIITYP